MNSGRDTAHRVAKPHRFEALPWLGGISMRPLLSLALSSPRSFFIEANVMLRTGVRFVSRCKRSRIKKHPPAARTQAIAIHRDSKPDLIIAREGSFDASALSFTGSDGRRRV
jgi:hypothetical protein